MCLLNSRKEDLILRAQPMKFLALAGFAFLATLPLATSQAAPLYHVIKTVPLGSPDKWDFIHFDPQGGLVYVAHGAEVTVVDPQAGKVLGRVTNIDGAHDVAVVNGRGYADNGRSGSVTVFDLATFKATGRIPADNDSDAMVYEPLSKRLVVANGDAHSASVIDVASQARLANVALPGSPEMMVTDEGGKVYINIASANEIVRFDPATLKLDGEWKIAACESPHGLAIDVETHRLFVSCHNARMLVINAENGSVVANLSIGHDTDGAAFDSKRKLAFSSNKDGTLSVVEEKSANEFVNLGNIPTAPGARTISVDPASGRVFLVTGDLAVSKGTRMVFQPGSVKLLILEPTK